MSAPDYPSYGNNPSDLPTSQGENLAETAKDDLATLGEEVGDQVAALSDEAKAQAGELAEKAKGMAGEQKDLLANQLGGVSQAINKVAAELEGQNDSSAQYVRMVADGADRLTSTLKDNSVDDILAIAQDFGRKQPAAFLGAAALLGFAASRFVLASANRDQANSASTAVTSRAEYERASTAPDYARAVGGDDAGI